MCYKVFIHKNGGADLIIKLLILLFLSLTMFACSEQTKVSDNVTENEVRTIYQDQLNALEKAKSIEEDILKEAQKRAQKIQQQGG